MITYLRGDATAPSMDGMKIIAHVVNDAGKWGTGFVLALSKRWPGPERSYRRWHSGDSRATAFILGNVQFVPVSPDTYVANMLAQHGIASPHGQPPIRYDALVACLYKVAGVARRTSASVHMPRFGGQWHSVEPLILEAMHDLPVYVYDFA